MSRVVVIARAVWEFFVGDDWFTAAGVVVAIAVTALMAAADAPAWWVMPIAVLTLLAASVRRRV